MRFPDETALHLAWDWGLLLFAALILIAAAVLAYRFTLPPLGAVMKWTLRILRAGALVLLLFLIFEPALTLSFREQAAPRHLLFLDNSISMSFKDGSGRKASAEEFVRQAGASDLFDGENTYLFGSGMSPVNADTLASLSFNEGSTDLSQLFSWMKENSSRLASATILTDGVITKGVNPLYAAERLGVPVFAVGTGDSTRQKDIILRDVLYNEYLYAGMPTTILASVTSRGYAGESLSVTLYEENRAVHVTKLNITDDGIYSVELPYEPSAPGEKKLSVVVESLNDEFTNDNNSKTFFLNVLDNKVKIALLASAPLPDVGFIRTALEADTNLTVTAGIVSGDGTFLGDFTPSAIDEADILFLIHFPSAATSVDLMERVRLAIERNGKPFFILASDYTDIGKMQILRQELPFDLQRPGRDILEAQALVSPQMERHPLLQHSTENIVRSWNDLPPVAAPNWEITTKPESELIAAMKVNAVALSYPMLMTRRLGANRSIALAARDIWRWKLQRASDESDLFVRFIHNSVRWLNANRNRQQVEIGPNGKLFARGEKILFSAEVYDESFNPVPDAEVSVTIEGAGEQTELVLDAVGSGLYEGSFTPTESGDFTYSGSASLDENELGSDAGRFNVGDVTIELIDPVQNAAFLKTLAARTKGAYYSTEEYSALFDRLEDINNTASFEEVETIELDLWSDEWLMAALILLFALEWFFRKREGLM